MKCSSCGRHHWRKRQRYCSRCHAEYQARYRRKLKREREAAALYIGTHLRNVTRETSSLRV